MKVHWFKYTDLIKQFTEKVMIFVKITDYAYSWF